MNNNEKKGGYTPLKALNGSIEKAAVEIQNTAEAPIANNMVMNEQKLRYLFEVSQTGRFGHLRDFSLQRWTEEGLTAIIQKEHKRAPSHAELAVIGCYCIVDAEVMWNEWVQCSTSLLTQVEREKRTREMAEAAKAEPIIPGSL